MTKPSGDPGAFPLKYKVVYKVIWPNGKIYIGSDLTDTISCFSNPDARRIALDYSSRESRRNMTITREILWESASATDAEVRRMERYFILRLESNTPLRDYNRQPPYRKARGHEPQA